MIPTRDEIERWLVTMRDEIDRLTSELKAARENEVAEGERADRNYDNVTKLRADLDRANTEAALARDALAKANQDHVMAKVTREANEAQIREQWDRIRAVTRQIIEVTGAPGPCSMEDAVGFIVAEVGRLRADLEIALAKATTPAPEREAAIRAWEEDALRLPDSHEDGPFQRFILERREITDAVALMRSADGKALLRELREDLEVYPDGIWTTREMVAKIGLLLAQPAPSHVYSRGKTIAESAEPPTAYYPPAPVEQPDAAVPDHFPDAGKMVQPAGEQPT